MPRSTKPLELVQIDHTMVDIMVVDDINRESIGQPWITMVFDVANPHVVKDNCTPGTQALIVYAAY